MLRANKHPLKDFTPTPHHPSSPRPFSALSLPLHSERAGSWDGGSAVKWWKHLSRLTVNIPDASYCLFLDTNQQASHPYPAPPERRSIRITLHNVTLAWPQLGSPTHPTPASYHFLHIPAWLFYPSLAVTDELTRGHQTGVKTIATRLILLPALCICEWVCKVSSARVLMNRCNRVGKNENEKGRGQARKAGVHTAPTWNWNFLWHSQNWYSDIQYKKVDATFSLMMKATACPSQLRFMASASPRMFREG